MTSIRIERKGVVEPDKWDNGGWFLDLRVWIDRPSILKRLELRAPHSILWSYEPDACVYRFRLWKRWVVADRYLMELS